MFSSPEGLSIRCPPLEWDQALVGNAPKRIKSLESDPDEGNGPTGTPD